MQSADAVGTADFAFVSRRNSSLIPGNFCLVFGSLAAISMGIAGGFALVGAWPLLPFAGLEVAALAVALRFVMRGADDYESVTIDGDDVVLDVRANSAERRFRFNRIWAQLVVRERFARVEVALRSHGREVELGRYLNDAGRRRLARELRVRLRGR